jgi:putative Mg2+ transporter-C (MgtC) family protein
MRDFLTQSDFEILLFLFPKVLLASLVGLIIGLERKLKHKVIGVKTNILICVGSMLFTVVSVLIADNGRTIAQVVSGVGFLGAGAIFRSNERVVGVTTGAYVWVVAALGILIGVGAHWSAIVLAIGLLVLTTIFARIEKYIQGINE